MRIIFFNILIQQESCGILLNLYKIYVLSLSRIDASTITLTIDIILLAHLHRALVALIFLEITWKIVGGINLLHIDSDAIDGLRIPLSPLALKLNSFQSVLWLSHSL